MKSLKYKKPYIIVLSVYEITLINPKNNPESIFKVIMIF